MTDMTVHVGNLTLPNPVLVASGTFGYAKEFKGLVDLDALGGIVTKTVTLEPRPGNAPPRIAETPSGMLNSIGLPNVGVDEFVREKMPFLRTLETRVIVNVAGRVGEEYAEIVERLDSVPDIDAYELNYSCPNVKEGGLSFSSDAQVAERVTRDVRRRTRRPVIAKLTPNVTSIADIGKAVEQGGADGISAINTLLGMGIDIYSRRPRLSTLTGGLSGPAIKPVALAKVYQLSKAVSVPIIGIGGIASAEDAIEFFMAGAHAVQIGTANFVQPDIATTVLQGILTFCEREHIHFHSLIGAMIDAS
jgi:dihydroorotate dehydrogenase (NAD+) catalytic subunit